MKHLIKTTSIFLTIFLLSACGTTSSLQSQNGNKGFLGINADTPNLSDYTVVSIVDFKNKTEHQNDLIIEKAGKDFADKIYYKLSREAVFQKIVRGPVEGRAVVIGGNITQYDDGNQIARALIGFTAGNSNFDADVILTDNETNAKLGSIDVDKNSWALGGPIAMNQTADSLMNDSIGKITKQIAQATKVKKIYSTVGNEVEN